MKLHVYNDEQEEKLENEFISKDVRRLFYKTINQPISQYCSSVYGSYNIYTHQSKILNIANFIKGKILEDVEPFDESDSWHSLLEAYIEAKFMDTFSSMNTLDFIDFIGELINEKYITIEVANEIFEKDNMGITFIDDDDFISIEIDSIPKTKTVTEEHESMMQLCERVDDGIIREDGGGVLHTISSIYELLAKRVSGKLKGNSLSKKGFEQYKEHSKLPEEFLSYIKKIYDDRNKTPNSGHGSDKKDDISYEEMIVMYELAKASIHIEDKLTNNTPKK